MIRPAERQASRFLVTGATGFLGRPVVEQLIARYGAGAVDCLVPPPHGGVRVHSVGTSEADAQRSLRDQGVTVITGDLGAFSVCGDLADSYDAVIHLAADNRKHASLADLRAVNEQGTENLLNTLGTRLRGARVVLTSTVLVHDRARRVRTPLTEGSDLTPRTPYGRSKMAGEAVVRRLATVHGYDYAVLRLASLYGAGMNAGLLHELHRLVESGSVLGRLDWPGRASVLYVNDAARIVIWAAQAAAMSNQTVLVASDESQTVGEMLEQLRSARADAQAPLTIPAALWQSLVFVRWLPLVNRLFPWSLGHLLEDGLFSDTSRLRASYTEPMTPLAEGLARVLRPHHTSPA